MRNIKIIAWLCIAALLVCVLAADSNANPTWYDQNPAVKPGIPDIGWVATDSRLKDKGYCGYVAAANVITYWDNHSLGNLVADGTTADDLMTNLIPYLYQEGTIPGTTCDELETGLENYFKDKGYGWMVINQYNQPNISLALIQNELKKCEQVIVGTVTHWMTGTGWYKDDGNTFLGFHDPNPFKNDVNSYLNTNYPNDWFYNTRASLELWYGGWTEIGNIITVSIPDPASLTLALIGLGTVGILRRRKALR